MALHTIQIVVVDGGKEGSYRANNATRKSTSTEEETDYREGKLYKILNLDKTIKNKVCSKLTIETRYMLGQAVAMGTQVAKSIASYYSSNIGRSTGDSNYQAIVNRRIEVIGQGINLVSSTISGAATGAMAGPVGAMLGGLVGLASSSMSLSFQHAEKSRAYNHTMAEEKAGRDYQIGRMTGGTGVRLR